MTSNLGSEYILDKNINTNELVNMELKKTFKPEFLNRIDEIVIFNPLDKSNIYNIIDNIILDIEDRLKDKLLKLKLSDDTKKYIIDNAYDETFGARPIKRFIAKNIESLIANNILEDKILYNSTIIIDVIDNKLVLTNKK